jgi:hypothetical protein
MYHHTAKAGKILRGMEFSGAASSSLFSTALATPFV